MIGSNVFGVAQGYQTQAGDIYEKMANTQPSTMKPTTLSNMNISGYMSPYTEQVIQRGEADIARQREQALNTLGAQATQASAFGGDRHGIAEGATYGEYGRMAGDFAAQQRQKAYQDAVMQAKYDAGQMQQADLTNIQSQQAAQRLGLAGLTGLGQTMFGQGMRGLEQQQRAADFAQRQQQMMLDAARQQLLANLGYPQQALQTGAGMLSGFPEQDVNVSGNPGLFDILSAVGSLKGLPV